MALVKSNGNMYPWVTHMHSHLRGRCPHKCSYCYVQAMERRFKTGMYAGPIRVEEKEFSVDYGSGKAIFIEHMNDLFADAVPADFVMSILEHCREYPDSNTYVFQTKNPDRYLRFLHDLPLHIMLGTTIESNRDYDSMTPAPAQRLRYLGLKAIRSSFPCVATFVNIEPIMDFNLATLLEWLTDLRPSFISIGADSKKSKLPEPSPEKVRALISGIMKAGIGLRQKHNLERLLTP